MSAARPPALQAADWLVRRDRGLTAAEQDDFHAWLAADPRHRAAFAREESTWHELDRLAEWRPEHSAEPNPDLLSPPRHAVWRKFGRLAPLAAAACLGVAFVLFRPAAFVPVASAVFTATGYEQRVLEDGSIAELNRGASISVDYADAERRVRLISGEAHFTVARNAARPFVVSAGGVEARAVGTAFHVRLVGRDVEVLVTEGRVQVEATDATQSPSGVSLSPSRPILAAGERVVVPHDFGAGVPLIPIPVSSVEIDRTLAWQPKLLEFTPEPLSAVVAAFNRHNAIQLHIADAELAELSIVATFRSDNLEGFLRLLSATAGVRSERTGDIIVLRRGKSR